MSNQLGILYLVATPIGNLEDITLRALRILKEVDLIAAEDTRTSKKLLNHFQISTPLTSYHQHNQESKGLQLIEKMLDGAQIAVITDAGLPGVSDPGSHLVQLAIQEGITVVPVPGANAALTGLVASGINTDRFLFHGFLPRKKQERARILEELAQEPRTVIIYESPHRLKGTLEQLLPLWQDRQLVVARELTKKFEEFVRGTGTQVLEHFKTNEPRGEITLILEGRRPGERTTDCNKTKEEQNLELKPAEVVLEMVEKGENKKEAIKQVSKRLGIGKRELYQMVLSAEGKKATLS